MKKTIAMLLSFLFIFGSAVVAVSAKSVETDEDDLVKDNIDDVGEKEFLYRDKFDEYISSIDFVRPGRSIVAYDELYIHKDESGVNDWALIYASSGQHDIEIGAYKVGNRVCRTNTSFNVPFHLDLAVYDINREEFVDLAYTSFISETYDGLGRYVDENCKGLGRLLGDMDRDDELTVVDCTLIQRCATLVNDWPEKDIIDVKPVVVEFPDLRYYSDFDCDGERDLVDATRLLRYVTYID